MKNTFILTAAGICAAGILACGQSAHASITTTYDNTIAPIVGSGNTAGGWTSATSDTAQGLTLSLRAQGAYVDGSTANVNGVYTRDNTPIPSSYGSAAGRYNWDYWFNVDNVNHSTLQYGYTLTIDDLLHPGQTVTIPLASFFPTDNGLAPAGSVFSTAEQFQNAESLSFLNDPSLHPSDIGSFKFTLDAYDYGNPTQLMDSVSIVVNNGTAAVPEPSTYVAGALMLLPLGMGVLRATRRKQAALESSLGA